MTSSKKRGSVPSFRFVVQVAGLLAFTLLWLTLMGYISFTFLHLLGSVFIVIAFFMFAESARELYMGIFSGPGVRSSPEQIYALSLILVICPVIIFATWKLIF